MLQLKVVQFFTSVKKILYYNFKMHLLSTIFFNYFYKKDIMYNQIKVLFINSIVNYFS